MNYKIDLEKFGDGPSLVERFKPREDGAEKFNIKVRKSDLLLIDKLAELSGRSRAFILNNLVRTILEEMLDVMNEKAEDFAALFASYVDQKCGKHKLSVDGWSAALFGLQPKNIYMPDENHQPSEEHQDLYRRIQAPKK
jgi:hypothetical protein